MNISLKKIPENEFDEFDIPLIFRDPETSRCFGILSTHQKPIFKLAWQSDLIDPLIKQVSENIWSVGIDQKWAAVDIYRNELLVTMSLTYNFLLTEIQSRYIFILTELEVLKLDPRNFNVIKCYQLPDFFEEMFAENDSIRVKCINGDIIRIE